MTKVPVQSIVVNAATLPLLHTQWTEILPSSNYAAAFLEAALGSTTPLQIAVGPIGKEVALPYTVIAGGTNGSVAQAIPANSRISLKPVDNDITDGFIVLNLFTGNP